jgi:hypothetical protein
VSDKVSRNAHLSSSRSSLILGTNPKGLCALLITLSARYALRDANVGPTQSAPDGDRTPFRLPKFHGEAGGAIPR